MKNKILFLILALLIVLPMVNAEIYVGSRTDYLTNGNNASRDIMNIKIDEGGQVYSNIIDYTFKDSVKNTPAQTSLYLLLTGGKDKVNDVGLSKNTKTYITIQVDVPNINGSSIDFCNLTIVTYTYDTNFINSTATFRDRTIETELFTNPTTAHSEYYTKRISNYEEIYVNFVCDYGSSTVPKDLAKVYLTAYLPQFSCTDYSESLEEAINYTQYLEEYRNDEKGYISKVNSVFYYNDYVWVVISWLVKIAYLFIAVTLIFFVFYFIYKLIRSVQNA
jgi:hypothetical protein